MTNTHSKRAQPWLHFIFILPLSEPEGVDFMQKFLTQRQKVLKRRERNGEQKWEREKWRKGSKEMR